MSRSSDRVRVGRAGARALARAKSEPLPGMRALAEFAHPALALIGFGFWAACLLSGARVFAAIG